jgi:hypothetical protein
MRNISFKKAIFTFFCIFAGFFSSACLESLDIDVFLEDKEVQDFIERLSEKVGLIDETGDDLRAGTGRIDGLKPGKYYIVDELNGSMASLGIKLVSSSGALSATQIGRVPGGSIINLVNENTYVVYSASPVSNAAMTYYDLNDLPVAGNGSVANTTGGILSLKAPDKNYFLNFTPIINNTSKIMKVPVSSQGTSANITIPADKIIRLEAINTTTDYVIYDDSNLTNTIFRANFKVLTVVVQPRPGITVNLALSGFTDLGPAVTAINFSQAKLFNSDTQDDKVTISINNYGTFVAGSVEWILGDHQESITTNSFTIDFSADYSYQNGLNGIGTHHITIIANRLENGEEKTYSSILAVTVTQ